MMAALFMLFCWVCGFILATAIRLPKPLALAWGSPIGIVVWGLASLVLLTLHLPFNGWTSAILTILVSAGILKALKIRRKDLPPLSPAAMFYLVLGALIFYVLDQWHFTLFTTDSYFFAHLGKLIGEHGTWIPQVKVSLTDWGILPVLLHASAGWFSEDYLALASPMFILSIAATLFVLSWDRKNSRASLPIAILAVGLFATCPGVLFHATHVHSNPMAAMYFLLFAWASCLSDDGKGRAQNQLLAIAVLGYSLSRPEGVLTMILSLSLVYDRLNHDRSAIQLALLIAAFWILQLCFFYSPHFDPIVTPARGAVFIVAALAAVAGLSIPRSTQSRRPELRVPLVVNLVLGIAVSALFLFQPQHMMTSTFSILLNLFQTGRWGFTWAAVLLALAAIRVLPLFGLLMNVPVTIKKGQRPPSLERLLIGNFLFVLLLAGFRENYHPAYTDTANRMMLHFLPVLIVILAREIIGSIKTRTK